MPLAMLGMSRSNGETCLESTSHMVCQYGNTVIRRGAWWCTESDLGRTDARAASEFYSMYQLTHTQADRKSCRCYELI